MNIESTLRCHRSAPVRSSTLHSRSKVIVPAGRQKSDLEWLSAVVGGGRFVCGEDTLIYEQPIHLAARQGASQTPSPCGCIGS